MRKYTEEEKKRYWLARCFECGWKGLTCDANGFYQIADTGDYSEGTCPKCDSEILEHDEEENKHLLWIFRKITFWATRKKSKEKRQLMKYIDRIS